MPKSDFGQILLNKKQELAERRADELEQEERKEQQTQKALQNLSDAVESSEFCRGAPDVSVRVAGGYFKVSVHSRPEDNFRSEIHFLSINWWDQIGYYRDVSKGSGDNAWDERVLQTHSVDEALAHIAEEILLHLESTRGEIARERARHEEEAFRSKAAEVGWSALIVVFFASMTIAGLWEWITSDDYFP